MSGNLFWGMRFRTCKNFWDFADSKSSLNPKNSYKYKSHTAITSIVIRVANRLQIKCESAIFRHCEANRRFAQSNPNKIKSARSVNPYKSFCYFLLLQKVESLYYPVIARFSESPNQSNPKNMENIKMISAEVFLMRNRGCEATSEEIRLGVY